MAFQGYQWATGLNNAGGLANIEDDVPRYQGEPFIIQGRGALSSGIIRQRADSSLYTTGLVTFVWIAPIMSEAQYDYIQDTYTVGGNSLYGLMTVRTLNDATTFANYNATMQIPDRSELTRKRNAFQDVTITFTNVEAL